MRKVLKVAALGEEKKCPKTPDKDEDDERRRKAVKKEVINEEFLTVTWQVACRQPFNAAMEEAAGGKKWGMGKNAERHRINKMRFLTY